MVRNMYSGRSEQNMMRVDCSPLRTLCGPKPSSPHDSVASLRRSLILAALNGSTEVGSSAHFTSPSGPTSSTQGSRPAKNRKSPKPP